MPFLLCGPAHAHPMKTLHRMILRNLPGPFFAAFGTLLFLLLMQFLINYLPELVGRGLPGLVIAELITYSLAYMVVLAAPMAVLVATLLVFGRLAESQAYAVAKSSGISLLGLAWPVVLAGAFLALGMSYFNSDVLPEANYRMKGLWQDIRDKKPGFELEPGVFYDGIDGYAIRVADAPAESNVLREVLIFDDSDASQRATITATRGELEAVASDALQMTLYDGEIHRLGKVRGASGREERYERIGFAQHRLRLDLSDLAFERDSRRTSRSDRTMRVRQMVQIVDSLDANTRTRTDDLAAQLLRLGQLPGDAPEPPTTSSATDSVRQALRARATALADTTRALLYAATKPLPDLPSADTLSAPAEPEEPARAALTGLSEAERSAIYTLAAKRMRTVKSEIDATSNARRWETQRADRYRVEIYKKYSMAVACVIFVLIGIPLGLSVRRGGLGVVGTVAVGIFLFYWITLVQGEKLADRGLLEPWVGMWAANVLIGSLGVYLLLRETRDPAGRDPLKRLLIRFRKPAS